MLGKVQRTRAKAKYKGKEQNVVLNQILALGRMNCLILNKLVQYRHVMGYNDISRQTINREKSPPKAYHFNIVPVLVKYAYIFTSEFIETMLSDIQLPIVIC